MSTSKMRSTVNGGLTVINIKPSRQDTSAIPSRSHPVQLAVTVQWERVVVNLVPLENGGLYLADIWLP